jgi:simple sugar transport system permease protein
MTGFWTLTLHQAVISAVPLAIAGLGELIVETAGVINLGVEGMMLIGAVSGYGAAVATGDLWLALLAAAAAGALSGGLHALLSVGLRVNQIAVGLTIVFLGAGLSGYAGQSIAGAPVSASFAPIALPGLSALPLIGPVLFEQDVVAYGTVLFGILLWAMLRHSATGLSLRAVGEDPATADSAGVPVARYRTLAVMAGGTMAGIAGAYFALSVAHAWAEQITAGRGWIAIALVIAANWRPLRLILYALVFGVVDSLNFSLQAIGADFPSSILQMLPYVFTLLVLVATVISRRGTVGLGPMALGRPYDREERV